MTSLDPTSASQHEEELIRICHNQLKGKESLLQSIIETLHAIHSALLSCNWQALRELLRVEETLACDDQLLRQDRDNLRYQFAVAFGMQAEEVTYEKIALHLSTTARTELLQARHRLHGLLGEADRLRHVNAVLLEYSRQFYLKILDGLGGLEVPERYGPAGKRQHWGRRSLILGRG